MKRKTALLDLDGTLLPIDIDELQAIISPYYGRICRYLCEINSSEI